MVQIGMFHYTMWQSPAALSTSKLASRKAIKVVFLLTLQYLWTEACTSTSVSRASEPDLI